MKRKLILTLTATAVSVLPPLLATLSCFPLWGERGGGAVLSGFAVVLLVMSAGPIFKLISRLFSSPSVPVMWVICFFLFFALSRVADEMVMISAVGAVSNIIGSILYRAAGRIKE